MHPSYPGPFIQFADSPWLEHLDHGLKRSFPANATILYPEDEVRHLCFVRQGAVLTRCFLSSQDDFKISIIGENGIVGIFEMFSPSPPKTIWHTLQPSICYFFSRECLEKQLPQSLFSNLLEQATLLSNIMITRFVQGANKHNDIRLARFLLHLIESCRIKNADISGGVTVIPGVTQELSSELLGIHPATFNKLLAAFRKCGIIGKSKKSGLEILDIAALTRYAEGEMPPLL